MRFTGRPPRMRESTIRDSRITIHFLWLVLASLALASRLGAQDLQARLQQRLDSLHRAGNFAGAQIGVALPDGKTIAVATGMADTARKEAMTTRHLLLQIGRAHV